jgi:hypothetical protein
VIAPWVNRKDVELAVPKEVRTRMQFVFARKVREALNATHPNADCREQAIIVLPLSLRSPCVTVGSCALLCLFNAFIVRISHFGELQRNVSCLNSTVFENAGYFGLVSTPYRRALWRFRTAILQRHTESEGRHGVAVHQWRCFQGTSVLGGYRTHTTVSIFPLGTR